MAGGSW